MTCVVYRRETADDLSSLDDPWRNFGETAAPTSITLNTNLRETLQDLTNVARNLSTEQTLQLEIRKLCEATLTINEAFYGIGRNLSQASKEQNKCTDLYNICCDLEIQWNQHHSTYKNLLWRSREFAGQAQCAVDEFRELVLPSLMDRNRTKSEKQEIIEEQIKILENTSEPSKNLSQEFDEFGRTLDIYITEFSRIVEGLGISEQTTKVSELGAKLRSTRDAMEAVSQEVKELGWKLASDIVVTGIVLLLAFLAPTFWTKLADTAAFGIDCMNVKRSGLQFFDAYNRRGLAIAKYEKTKTEFDIGSACLSQMVKLESTLRDSRPLVHEVIIKLGIFAWVWAAIRADIGKLKNYLRRAENTASPLFIARVKTLESMYGYLSQALRDYQVTVRLPQPSAHDEEKTGV